MDVEHRKLLAVIREATSDMREEPKDRVMLRAEMPTRLDAGADTGDWRSRVITAKLVVSYTGTDSVENLQIEVAATEPVVVDQDLFTVESLSGGSRTPLLIPIKVCMRDDILPASMELPVLATYLTSKGEPRTARWDIQLPLCLVCTGKTCSIQVAWPQNCSHAPSFRAIDITRASVSLMALSLASAQLCRRSKMPISKSPWTPTSHLRSSLQSSKM
eukprot:SAG31_NODE_1295_length_8952_cov_8.332957_4_plen_217_part_00